ncbi:MAG: GNAT family N-acetyltransferase, partial [Bacteroidaceae bacterium]|nr:GNAT family N-acetyltransferase [Bacteroidaceae bacterium]
DEGRRIVVLDFLYDYLIHERFKHLAYLDFGVSVEQGGHYLNNGLIAQKEGLGGRAVMYDTYAIEIKNR